MEHGFFERQLAAYSAYHREPRNRLTHFVGIPMIVFSLLALAAPWSLSVGGIEISAAWIAALAAAAGWIALDPLIGAAMLAALVPMVLIAGWAAGRYGTAGSEWLFAAFFVGGWIFQFVGHAFERRRPALMDNLFQAFVGPMFVMAELLAALRIRRRPDLA